jgi:hypothetical protein
MKTKVIDGVTYEVLDWVDGFMSNDDNVIILRPLPPKPKTMVQVAAEVIGRTEEEYRNGYDKTCMIWDAIEQRLQAIEKKLEGK